MTHYHPMQSAQAWEHYQQMQQRDDAHYLMNAAKTGAVVGATGAAALSLHAMRRDGITWQDAVTRTARAGVNAGLATAAAAAVGRMMPRQPLLSMTAAIATATAVMYVLQDKTGGAADE